MEERPTSYENRGVSEVVTLDVIQHVLLPLIDPIVLNRLKATSSTWREMVREFLVRDMPRFVLKKSIRAKCHAAIPAPRSHGVHGGLLLFNDYDRRIDLYDGKGELHRVVPMPGELLNIIRNQTDCYDDRVVYLPGCLTPDDEIMFGRDTMYRIEWKKPDQEPVIKPELTECVFKDISVDANGLVTCLNERGACVEVYDPRKRQHVAIYDQDSVTSAFHFLRSAATMADGRLLFLADSLNACVYVLESSGARAHYINVNRARWESVAFTVVSRCGKYLLQTDHIVGCIRVYDSMSGEIIASHEASEEWKQCAKRPTRLVLVDDRSIVAISGADLHSDDASRDILFFGW